ncbi:hypothetical protein BGX30_007511 [Mortierella sp. GBA39]|nr:hypothetical protein BGX30_007511 [Mortierella sp. GBA39]
MNSDLPPEICTLLATRLGHLSLGRITLLNKACSKTWTPYLYNHLRITTPLQRSRIMTAKFLKALSRNARFIRTIQTRYPLTLVPFADKGEVPTLQLLALDILTDARADTLTQEEDLAIVRILERSPGLLYLNIRRVPIHPVRILMTIVRYQVALRSLSLFNVTEYEKSRGRLLNSPRPTFDRGRSPDDAQKAPEAQDFYVGGSSGRVRVGVADYDSEDEEDEEDTVGAVQFQMNCLEFSFESGLHLLAGLKELRILDVTFTCHRIGVPESEWMENNLPNLASLRGLDPVRSMEDDAQCNSVLKTLGFFGPEALTWARTHKVEWLPKEDQTDQEWRWMGEQNNDLDADESADDRKEEAEELRTLREESARDQYELWLLEQ